MYLLSPKPALPRGLGGGLPVREADCLSKLLLTLLQHIGEHPSGPPLHAHTGTWRSSLAAGRRCAHIWVGTTLNLGLNSTKPNRCCVVESSQRGSADLFGRVSSCVRKNAPLIMRRRLSTWQTPLYIKSKTPQIRASLPPYATGRGDRRSRPRRPSHRAFVGLDKTSPSAVGG